MSFDIHVTLASMGPSPTGDGEARGDGGVLEVRRGFNGAVANRRRRARCVSGS